MSYVQLQEGYEELFGINARKQCVVNSLVAIIFNATASCLAETWNSTKMDNILRMGNSLYSYIIYVLKHHLSILHVLLWKHKIHIYGLLLYKEKFHSPFFAHQLKNLPENNHPFSLVKINNAKAFTSPLSTLNINQAARLFKPKIRLS